MRSNNIENSDNTNKYNLKDKANVAWNKETIDIKGEKYLIITINNTNIDIPLEYIGQNPPNDPFIDIVILWPKIIPVTSIGENNNYDAIRVGLSFRNTGRKEYQDEYRGLKILEKQNKVSAPIQSEYYPTLMRYEAPGQASYYFNNDSQHLTPTGNPLLARCLHKGTEDSIFHCQMGMVWSENITLRFTFESKLLPYMSEVYIEISKLINSF